MRTVSNQPKQANNCQSDLQVRTVQITLILALGEKGQPRSVTSDDLDTWQVIKSVFLGAELQSDIQFATNNHPDSQTRKKKKNTN